MDPQRCAALGGVSAALEASTFLLGSSSADSASAVLVSDSDMWSSSVFRLLATRCGPATEDVAQASRLKSNA
jgi:hypothetical protein